LSFVIVINHFGLNAEGLSALVFTSFLIVLTVVDIDHQLLPDNLTLPLMWGGILLSLWSVHTDLTSSVLGAVAGYMSLWLIYHIFRILTGKEGMGYGDFKLLGAIGAWLGWQSLLQVILVSSVIGVAFGVFKIVSSRQTKDQPFPFGPFLAVAGWVTILLGDKLNYLLQSPRFFG
jgi:leader peptidase (prepilin peptidase)/N-methyltransferase